MSKVNSPPRLIQFIKEFKKNPRLLFDPEWDSVISYLQNSLTLDDNDAEKKEASKILRRLLPKKKIQKFFLLRPDLLLFEIDRYERIIKKELPGRYKGEGWEEKKTKDAKALFEKIFRKTFPRWSTLDVTSKRTIAVSFVCAHHQLRYKTIRQQDDYWNKLKKDVMNRKQGKPIKSKPEEVSKFYEMLRKVNKTSLFLKLNHKYFPES
ncbi:MAG TPA: hypothetical protein VHT73_00120 [Thermodesulfobacteriota bacterium]|nr:hypothetical protein [Thermodesulfobacteriota bacterium]